MSDSVAEAYLLILRPSRVPVLGEAVPTPFEGQIEIDEWSWSLENEEFAKKKKTSEKQRDKEKEDLQKLADAADDDSEKANADALNSLNSLPRQISAIQRRKDLSEAERAKRIRELIDDAAEAGETAEQRAEEKKQKRKKVKDDDDDGEERLKFTFKKNMDAASTQLLNSLKSGDVMPQAIITLFHRSSNAPVTLAIKFEKVRLKSFTLSVDTTDTMSDLKEEWTANYESMEYSYQNRPAASGPNGLTKGTVRVFKTKKGSLI
jgi:type VI protein secretion system component Hcp